jgi:hypothetical protein
MAQLETAVVTITASTSPIRNGTSIIAAMTVACTPPHAIGVCVPSVESRKTTNTSAISTIRALRVRPRRCVTETDAMSKPISDGTDANA